MPRVVYERAEEKDFHDVVDFLDYVFSAAHAPTDFENLLPALYSAEDFMSGVNYFVKEDNKIVANVGAYPAVYDVCGDKLKITGITSVAVHPRTRSKGYMKNLMNLALEDMKSDGTALSFLLGRRQRYEYFGFTPSGIMLKYNFNKNNFRHGKINVDDNSIELRELSETDINAFDEIFLRHNKQPARVERERDKIAKIMKTWGNKAVGVYVNGVFTGYISASKDYGEINEINLDDPDMFLQTIGVFSNRFNREDVGVLAYPHETALITRLARLAESVSVSSVNCYNVLDYRAVLNAFLKLKLNSSPGSAPDGKVTIKIDDICINIKISGGNASVFYTDDAPDIECTRHEAARLFFSPDSIFLARRFGNSFLNGILPVPLFIRKNDQS